MAVNLSKRARSAAGGAAITLMAALMPTLASAQAPDPHAIYETRCAGCHDPHARGLAQKTLELKGSQLLLKGTGQRLADFLTKHPRRPLSNEDAAALERQLMAMLQSGFLFQEKCIACHERASVLARLRLIERDGALTGRYTGRDIATFMQGHGRLDDSEVEVILAMLKRQLAPPAVTSR